MLDSKTINSNFKPENPHIAKYEGVIVNAICSQAFLFGDDMGKYRIGKTTQITIFCSQCNKPKKIYPFLQNQKHHFCNKKCHIKWQTKNMKGKYSPAWKGGNVIAFCSWCNKPKEINLYKKYNQKYHFCSQECKKIWMSGENAPSWRGGISTTPYCFIWSDWEYKQSIKDRDNNECQNKVDCRKNSNHLPLCLHHIDHNKQECNPWDIITVCHSCNGRANFNIEYWKEFYQNIMTEKYGYKY